MRVCLASRHSQQLCMRQQVCKSTPDERRLEPCNTCARRFNTEKGHSLCKVMNTNNKEAPMHDALMPFGIRTTSDHSSDQGSPHSPCSRALKCFKSLHTLLGVYRVYRDMNSVSSLLVITRFTWEPHLSVVRDKTYRQHHEWSKSVNSFTLNL